MPCGSPAHARLPHSLLYKSVATEPQTPAMAKSRAHADGMGATPTEAEVTELWDMLDALRRKLDDNAALGRQTQHTVAQLTESLAGFVAAQRRRSRFTNLNSFVAYLVFTLLLGTAFFFLYQARTHALVRDQRELRRELAAAHARLAAIGRTATSLESGAAAPGPVAAEASGASDEARSAGRAPDSRATDTLPANPAALLAQPAASAGPQPMVAVAPSQVPPALPSPVIEDPAAHATAQAQADAALAAYRATKYSNAIAQWEQALASAPTHAQVALWQYYAGIANLKINHTAKAEAALTAALAGEADLDDVRYYYACALDAAGKAQLARAAYLQFADAHPEASLATKARLRAQQLASGMPAKNPLLGAGARVPPGWGSAHASAGQPPAGPAGPTAGSRWRPHALPAKPASAPAKSAVVVTKSAQPPPTHAASAKPPLAPAKPLTQR